MYKDKCIAIWGVGNIGRGIANIICELGFNLVAFIDSKPHKASGSILNIPIYKPDEFKSLALNDIDILIIGVERRAVEAEILESVNLIKSETGGGFAVQTSREARNYLCRLYLETKREAVEYRWDIDFKYYVADWVNNLDSEVEFWKGVCSNQDSRDGYLSKLTNKEFSGIDVSVESLETNLEAGSIVVDLGCGLVSMYGTNEKNGGINIIPMDPLAAFYNVLNSIHSPIEMDSSKNCKFGLFEFVDSFLPEDYADVILINNALDHCIDSFRSIVKCVVVLKKGGVLRLVHRRAEAVFEGWIGLHKWNVDYNSKDELILWNKTNKINVSQELEKIAEVKLSHSPEETEAENSYITVEITKKNEVDLAEYSYENDSKELAFMLGEFMKKYADISLV